MSNNQDYLEHKKKSDKKEFLKKCQDILNNEFMQDEDKFQYIIYDLSKIESDIENILITIITNKARDRLDTLKESSNLLESALHFIESKPRGKDHKQCKDLLFDKSKKFYKTNYPTVVYSFSQWEK
jgi:hypothetical protein